MLVVSHDRYFLDRVTNRTLELYHGTVESYPGNFTQYKRLKAERLEVQRRTYEKQQEEIAKMEDFIRRYHYGDRHQQAEDRRKKLERIERVAAAARDRRAADGLSAGLAHRRHRAAGRAAGQELSRQAAVRQSLVRHSPRRKMGHSRPQRLRQDDAAAVPARRAGSSTTAASSSAAA